MLRRNAAVALREESRDGEPVVVLESEHLIVEVAPGVGGRIARILGKQACHEFLWRNASLPLKRLPPGSAYDPNFYGGIDELLPNDIPETINGTVAPDHGELWTTALESIIAGESLILRGALPLCGLEYERRMQLRPHSPHIDIDYRLANPTAERRVFLWKLHAALNIEPGDTIVCSARKARVADLAWSRRSTTEPFDWPLIQSERGDIMPRCDGTTDFFYLYNLDEGEIAWRRPSRNLTFAYSFDKAFLPYAWIFASYGGFFGHYTAIIQPSTAMPISVNEAARLGQCSVLDPGEALQTRVTIYAGPG